MKIAFDSPEATELNARIFEAIYYGSLAASCELADEREDIIQEYIELSENEEVYESIADNELEYEDLLQKMRDDYHILDEELIEKNIWEHIHLILVPLFTLDNSI